MKEESKDAHVFLKEFGYRFYPSRVEWPHEEKALYQKKIDSPSVCETNDGLYINVHLCRYYDNPKRSFEVEITAEKNDIWWRLMAYSISENELFSNLVDIERTLSAMFNSIPNVQASVATGDDSSK